MQAKRSVIGDIQVFIYGSRVVLGTLLGRYFLATWSVLP